MPQTDQENKAIELRLARFEQFIRDFLWLYLGLRRHYISEFKYEPDNEVLSVTISEAHIINIDLRNCRIYIHMSLKEYARKIWNVLTKNQMKNDLSERFHEYISKMKMEKTYAPTASIYQLPLEKGILGIHMAFSSDLTDYLQKLSSEIMQLMTEENIRVLLKSGKVIKRFRDQSSLEERIDRLLCIVT